MKKTEEMTVVKMNRTKETFNRKKLYDSIHHSCLSAELSKLECQRLAKQILKEVLKVLDKEHCLLAEEISSTVGKAMHKRKKELAFMYRTHKDIS